MAVDCHRNNSRHLRPSNHTHLSRCAVTPTSRRCGVQSAARRLFFDAFVRSDARGLSLTGHAAGNHALQKHLCLVLFVDSDKRNREIYAGGTRGAARMGQKKRFAFFCAIVSHNHQRYYAYTYTWGIEHSLRRLGVTRCRIKKQAGEGDTVI